MPNEHCYECGKLWHKCRCVKDHEYYWNPQREAAPVVATAVETVKCRHCEKKHDGLKYGQFCPNCGKKLERLEDELNEKVKLIEYEINGIKRSSKRKFNDEFAGKRVWAAIYTVQMATLYLFVILFMLYFSSGILAFTVFNIIFWLLGLIAGVFIWAGYSGGYGYYM